MAVSIVPPNKPLISKAKLLDLLEPFKNRINQDNLYLVGIRGYYRNSLGVPGQNDRGIYDDAILLVSPFAYATFNANTDPSIFKKHIAVLKTGIYFAHKFAIHHPDKPNGYPAICQRLGSVTVIRDGNPPVEDTGDSFGINIHKGGLNSTSSIGCQTIYPTQWTAFYNLAKEQAIRLYGDDWNKTVIPYILIENNGEI